VPTTLSPESSVASEIETINGEITYTPLWVNDNCTNNSNTTIAPWYVTSAVATPAVLSPLPTVPVPVTRRQVLLEAAEVLRDRGWCVGASTGDGVCVLNAVAFAQQKLFGGKFEGFEMAALRWFGDRGGKITRINDCVWGRKWAPYSGYVDREMGRREAIEFLQWEANQPA
jgi:hypothetical protein